MYRLGLEAILGLQKQGNVLRINPCIPTDWPVYEIMCHFGETAYCIRVENPKGVNRGVKQLIVDGEVILDGVIPLEDDRQEHKVLMKLG